MKILRAQRLTLIAYNAELAGLQEDDPPAFFAKLGVKPVAPWPPQPFDAESFEWVRASLAVDPEGEGWYGWVMALEAEGDLPRQLVGAAALVGRPEDGEVELGFGVTEEFRGHGFAAEAVRMLSGWAAQNGAVRIVVHVDGEDDGSAKTLAKNGFQDTQEPPYPGVARWALAVA